jgi:predicted glycoside hydrolase/deacetylase ChbG (UPF0249 family)
MRRLVLCADDYALTPGVSRSIRELIAARRISATSVMTVSPVWPAEAAALRAISGDADIGLHVTLTDQVPLGVLTAFAPKGRFPSRAETYGAALLRRLPMDEVRAEIERQYAAFVEHYGVPPAHIDGHHHVQQLPGVRDIVLDLARRAGPLCYVRTCHDAPSRILQRGVASAKALTIAALGRGMRRHAVSAGIATNTGGFSGAFDFQRESRGMGELFERFLQFGGDNHLVMCHPGFADATLAEKDPMIASRDQEHAFLMSDAWPALVARLGYELGPLRR